MPKSNAQPKKTTLPTAKRRNEKSRKKPAKILLISFASGVSAFFLSIFALSFLLEKSPDPNALVPIASIIITMISAVISGTVAAKISGKAAPWSVLSGLMLILFYLMMSLFFDEASYETSMAIKSTIVTILPVASFIAGTLSGRKKSAQKKR